MEEAVISENLKSSTYHHYFEVLPIGVVVINQQGQVTRANVKAKEILGFPLIHHSWIEIVARAFAPRMDDGHEVSLKDGRRVSVAISSLKPNPGEIITLQDLSMTRDWQESQRLQAMGRMTAHVAHQIRTPLTSAMLYTQHGLNTALNIEKREQFLRKALGSLGNIEQQIRDMLCFASGGTRVFEQISVGEFIQILETNTTAVIMAANAVLEIDNQAQQEILVCHTESLQGALLNLINNALQACDESPFILLSLRADHGCLHIVVSDNGRGMNPDVQEKVLEPFYTTRAQGTGLGLAVVQAVAKLHGGQITIASAEGVGTSISLHLPILKGEKE